MRRKYLSRLDAERYMVEANGSVTNIITQKLDSHYTEKRRKLLIIDNIILAKEFGYTGDVTEALDTKNYKYDLLFGLQLYNLLTVESDEPLSISDASRTEYWSYLSVLVIPDIVERRWHFSSHERFYSKPSRVWLYTLWWYIHLSWQGSIESTYEILKNNSTDTILNFIERTGPKGYNIELYRNLVNEYSKIDLKTIKNKERHIFRSIMVTNTALIQTIEPSFYYGGELGYVKKLFNSVGLIEKDERYVGK